ncbi:MAG: tRNA (adenosine(37)-N6)-threonylcarbamoyltransferase complex dimerization subunit type 1 TsaB [Candidatus Glassbacteria bacterium]
MNDPAILIAIETSTNWSSVALIRGPELIAETGIFIRKDHSGPLGGRIDRIIRDAGLGVEEIDGVVVPAGPGSFTGLRVGVGFAKGFICGSGRQLYAVSSLKTIAAGLPFCELPICSLLDARKGEVYAQVFRWERGDLLTVSKPVSSPPDEILESIQEETIFAGSGCLVYRELLERELGGKAHMAPSTCSIPRAAVMGHLVSGCPEEYLVGDPQTFEPAYIRPPEAVVRWRRMK